jgi:hypothetical protein
MNKQLKVAEFQGPSHPRSAEVFDRAVLAHQTMDDGALAGEILGLFLAQIDRLDRADWTHLELAFEMHSLRGAAAVMGAHQIVHLAEHWKKQGTGLERKLKLAFSQFRTESEIH